MQEMMEKMMGGMGGGEGSEGGMGNLMNMAQQMMGGGAAGKMKMPPGMPKSMMRMGKR